MNPMLLIGPRPAIGLAICLLVAQATARADDATPSSATNDVSAAATNAADTAWENFQKASQPPPPPVEWQTNQPTDDQIEKFHVLKGGIAGLAADKARDFYTRFPADPRASDAKDAEFMLLRNAVLLGNTNQLDRYDTLETAHLKDSSVPEEERVQLYQFRLQRHLAMHRDGGLPVALAEYEKTAREMIAALPDRPEGYGFLLTVAANVDPAKGKALAQEVASNTNAAALKPEADKLLQTLDMPGKPVAVQFTAVDGRAVDTDKLKGKVVLLDFWATWCKPCVAEVPDVKDAYEKLHSQGFEIVGISLDQDQQPLQNFVKANNMPWPQYFDGKGFENKFAQQFGIDAIPAMWLIDKKGVLRDTNARMDLAEKVAKLLAE